MFKMVNGIEVPLSEEEVVEFNKREQEHLIRMEELEKTKYQENRRREYPSIDALLVALVEKEEGRPEALAALMELRAEVKAKYPKPV